ncbi:hypothetical protein M422DRAFT_243097 [Sphaerobolus stellatus SS14]|nr:hypothetical protein M422DRAFT_243097 [Sphaerobolus stellatus SS14]
MQCKEDRAELIKDVRDALRTLLQSETQDDFEQQWVWIQEEYDDQCAFMKYMRQEWIPTKEQWARAWRKIHVESFAQDDVHYIITLTDEKIVSCNCQVHVQSYLTCKHVFLALRVTHYVIHLSHIIVPKHRAQDDLEDETVEQQRAYKHRMISKAREVAYEIAEAGYWWQGEKDEVIDTLSKDTVTRLFSALDGMRHLSQDAMTARPDVHYRKILSIS